MSSEHQNRETHSTPTEPANDSNADGRNLGRADTRERQRQRERPRRANYDCPTCDRALLAIEDGAFWCYDCGCPHREGFKTEVPR